ncbi:MAG: right-handed parallel beta-helix repeat-containing protein, partial [Planctomycetota bacterium]
MSCSLQTTPAQRTTVSFHVSPEGDDTNPGTETKPFKTLRHAQQFLQQNDLKGKKKITVYLHEGVYAFDQSLTFLAEDSGTKDVPILFTAYQDESVTLIGGKELLKK